MHDTDVVMQNFLKFEEKFAYFMAIANYPTIRKLIKLQHLQYHYLIQMLICMIANKHWENLFIILEQ